MNCPEDPTEGWTEYQDSFHVERPYNMPINTRFSIIGGIYKLLGVPQRSRPTARTAMGRNPRTEATLRRDLRQGERQPGTGVNDNIGYFTTGKRMYSADMLIERNAVGSAFMQIHTTAAGGGPIGIRMQGNGDIVNNGSLTVVQGNTVPGGLVDKWFNFKASLNADTLEVKIYINNCLKSTYKGDRGRRQLLLQERRLLLQDLAERLLQPLQEHPPLQEVVSKQFRANQRRRHDSDQTTVSERHRGGVAVGAALRAEAKPAAGRMPTRVLGKTGVRVSILAMGGGSRFLMYKEEDKALEALNRAFDLGITYMDTAFGYGNGLSEERVGKVMKDRRKGIFLATKINKRKGDEAMKILEGSLKRLQTDQVDLIHIHDLKGADDLAAAEAKDGVLAVLRKLRDQKVTRFIGVTSHTDPDGAEDRARAARLRLHPDGAQRRPGGDEGQPQGHDPQPRHDRPASRPWPCRWPGPRRWASSP